jgi:hypothetical protein
MPVDEVDRRLLVSPVRDYLALSVNTATAFG